MAVAPSTAPWYVNWLKFLSSMRPTSVTTPILSVDAEAAGDGLAATDGAADGAIDGSTDGAADGAAADGATDGVGVAEPLHADATIASIAASRPSRVVRVIMNSSLRELGLERAPVSAIAQYGRADCCGASYRAPGGEARRVGSRHLPLGSRHLSG